MTVSGSGVINATTATNVPVTQYTVDDDIGSGTVEFTTIGSHDVTIHFTPTCDARPDGMMCLNGFVLDENMPELASNPTPANGAVNVVLNPLLIWTPGISAAFHDVYFGTSFEDVNTAADPNTLPGRGRQEPNSYSLASVLELGTEYYWRIDEVNGSEIWKGRVWSFTTTVANIVSHSIVYGSPDLFCAWPANNGVWTWGDNEILVGLLYAPYVEKSGHNYTSPRRAGLARSLDGGQTWAMEDPDNFDGDGGTLLDPPGGVNFMHPDFALRVGREGVSAWFISYDRGHSWQGPYGWGALMSNPELSGFANTSRTDYLVNTSDDCLLGMSIDCGPTDRAFMARTTDASASFSFVAWINPEEDCSTRGVMPSTVRISDTKLVTTLRRKYPGQWIDAFVSYDNGNSWSFLSRVADTYTDNGNPPALVRLTDGRLCCAYGNRLDCTMEARISEDQGATWSEAIILRDDYQTDAYGDADLGYPRIVQRPDGKLVTMYYWATLDHPTQHIAATIWDPPQPSCQVHFIHYARFAQHWLETGCGPPDWCGGADLDHIHDVDEADLSFFGDEWLQVCPPDWPWR
jgi:hypothetical protein